MTSKAQQMSNDMDMLNTLIERGFTPKSVIDGGASVGDWTRAVKNALPNAEFLLIEPREWCRSRLESMVTPNVKYVRELLSSRIRTVEFYEHGEQSSTLRNTKNEKWGEAVRMQTTTLDKQASHMEGPILLKLDLQGAELDVLEGAENILPNVEVIFMEVTLFPFMSKMPLIPEVLEYMDEIEFMVYDIFNRHTRPIDGRVGQFDICFISKTSQLNDNIRWSDEW